MKMIVNIMGIKYIISPILIIVKIEQCLCTGR